MAKNILCDIGEKITLLISGKAKVVSEIDLFNNINKIYRIQFSRTPQKKYFDLVVNILKENKEIDLRFYGDYSEDFIDWESLIFIERLQIDLWQSKELKAIESLKNLKRLSLSKWSNLLFH